MNTLTIDNKTLRFLAHMGARGCLGQAVIDAAVDGEDSFFLVSADLGIASGFQRFMEAYPDRFVNTGIAEQNLISVAAGLSDASHPVIATSWGAFASYRCADQIRNYLGLMQSNVKVVGMDSGITISRFGGCHYALGDTAMMRSMPGITVLCPCDGLEIYQTVQRALETPGPMYIRLTGGQRLPIINRDPGYRFEIGKASVLAQGSDVAVIGCGVLLEECLAAVKLLEEKGISCTLLNMSTIKPIDRDAILAQLGHKLIVTVEEHNIFGGLGSAVAEVLTGEKMKPRQMMLGIEDFVPATGTYSYLLESCGLTGVQLAEKIEKALEDEK